MPRAGKYTDKTAPQFLEEYGYTVPENFHYVNMRTRMKLNDLYTWRPVVLTMSQIAGRVRRGTRPRYIKPENANDIMNIGTQPGRIALTHEERRQVFDIINDVQPQPGRVAVPREARRQMFDVINDVQPQPRAQRQQRTQEERIFDKLPKSLDFISNYEGADEEETKQRIKRKLPILIREMRRKMRQVAPGNVVTLIEPVANASANEQAAVKNTLLLALTMLKKELFGLNAKLSLTSTDGKTKEVYLNEVGYDLLKNVLLSPDQPNPHDSNEKVRSAYYIEKIASIKFEFSLFRRGRHVNPGFFPFVNVSTIDLSAYGIYGPHDERRYHESCLIKAIEQSGALDVDELKRLRHFVKTRTFLIEQLPKICEEFDVSFSLRLLKPDGHGDVRKYGNGSRVIRLIVLYSHYMIDKLTDVTSFFIDNYTEFKDYGSTNIFRNKAGEIVSYKCTLNICTLVAKMLEKGLLIPMTMEEITDVKARFKLPDVIDFNRKRLIEVKAPKQCKYFQFTQKPKQGKLFFGYTPEPNEVGERLMELQRVCDSLPLRNRIDVSQYYRYSNLMQRIMYEFGCFDGVYESCGADNQALRAQIKYPRPHSDYNGGKPFEITGKLYYVDMNSAYMSFIDGIPTDLTNEHKNNKITELIHKLYDLRNSYKQTNPKLSKTLKFLMNSCYGYSLKKAKEFHRKFANSISTHVDNYGDFVFASYSKNGDNRGFVDSKCSFCPDYNCVQFGADIMKNYNEYFDHFRSTVKVYYENVDAFLIDEDDFNKLQAAGLVGDKLGQFKCEHVFDRFEYKSGRKWRGWLGGALIDKRGEW